MSQGHRAGPSALYFYVGRDVKKAWKNEPIFLDQPIEPVIYIGRFGLGHWACEPVF